MLLRWPREKHCLTLRCRELASALRCGLQPGRVKFRLGASAWWALPGTGGRAVAVEDFGAVGAAGGGGAVGIEGDGPAPLMDRYMMVEETVQGAAVDAGLPAVGQVGHMVHFTGCGGLVAAAGPAAMLVAQDDRAADRGGDLGAAADVQRQAGPGQAGAELPGAQEDGQPARAGDQVDGRTDDRVAEHLQRLRRGGPRAGRAEAVIGQLRTVLFWRAGGRFAVRAVASELQAQAD